MAMARLSINQTMIDIKLQYICFAPQPLSKYIGQPYSNYRSVHNNNIMLSPCHYMCTLIELKGERYNNNSVVTILAIGEGSSALLCKTNKQDCRGTLYTQSVWGILYYPHGAYVLICITGDDFYHYNRGNQMI